tara:strand:- start:821 stop:955 length:135 start_codon:yes stop_codon:yes gene_type:complete
MGMKREEKRQRERVKAFFFVKRNAQKKCQLNGAVEILLGFSAKI